MTVTTEQKQKGSWCVTKVVVNCTLSPLVSICRSSKEKEWFFSAFCFGMAMPLLLPPPVLLIILNKRQVCMHNFSHARRARGGMDHLLLWLCYDHEKDDAHDFTWLFFYFKVVVWSHCLPHTHTHFTTNKTSSSPTPQVLWYDMLSSKTFSGIIMCCYMRKRGIFLYILRLWWRWYCYRVLFFSLLCLSMMVGE